MLTTFPIHMSKDSTLVPTSLIISLQSGIIWPPQIDVNGLMQWRTLPVCRSTWFVMADQRWIWVGSASSCTPVPLHFHLLYEAWMRLLFSWSNLVIFHSNHTQGWSRSFFYWSGPSVMSFISECSGVSVKDRQKTHTRMAARTNTPYTSLLHL